MAAEKNIRAFLAIEPPEEVLAAITRLQEKLKGEIAGKISWTRPQGNHLTLKFFGDIGSTDVEKIGTAVKIQLATVSSIVLKIEKIDVFPDLKRPRVIWAGTTGDIEKLTMLQNKLDVDFAGLGFPTENRPFRAHLTLGRIKVPHGAAGIGEAIKKHSDFTAGEFRAAELILFQSQLTPHGAIYTKLEKFPFCN